jgi:hypothetical protein
MRAFASVLAEHLVFYGVFTLLLYYFLVDVEDFCYYGHLLLDEEMEHDELEHVLQRFERPRSQAAL